MVKTFTFQVDTPHDRTLQITLPPDLPLGRLEIVMVVVPTASPTLPIDSLEGRWQPYFDDSFDLDAALHEIRHEWEKEWIEHE